jgi:hypothetical protein
MGSDEAVQATRKTLLCQLSHNEHSLIIHCSISALAARTNGLITSPKHQVLTHPQSDTHIQWKHDSTEAQKPHMQATRNEP